MTTKIKDGGPAFPLFGHEIGNPITGVWADHGMSLRDYFAAKAMQGILSNDESAHAPENLDEVVAWCWKIADAMLAAREATNDRPE